MNPDQFIPPFKYINGEKAKASFASTVKEIRLIDPERSKEAAKKVLQRCDVAFRLLAEYERKERARERCLANSTRPRHSRSTLRKTKV